MFSRVQESSLNICIVIIVRQPFLVGGRGYFSGLISLLACKRVPSILICSLSILCKMTFKIKRVEPILRKIKGN